MILVRVLFCLQIKFKKLEQKFYKLFLKQLHILNHFLRNFLQASIYWRLNVNTKDTSVKCYSNFTTVYAEIYYANIKKKIQVVTCFLSNKNSNFYLFQF